MTDLSQKQIKYIAVYARVSTSNQEDQKTIEAQLSEVHAFAEKRGYEIVKEYTDEGWSGDILNRPSLDQMRIDAKKKIWDAVLIYDPDRLGRQLFYQQIVIDELKQLEIEIFFVTMPPIKNPTDELMFGVRGLFSQYEKGKITERFRIGKVNRVKNGHVLTSVAPYGYSYILNKGKRSNVDYVPGHYVVNDDEAKIIKKIFTWIADDKLTIRGVIRELQKLNIKPRKSIREVWSTSTLSSLLRNEVYIGNAYWGASYAVVPENPLKFQKYRRVKKTSRKMRPKSEWYPIKVPAIIDEDLFKRAGLQLKKNFEILGRNKVNEYLLVGMVWCICGGRRTGEGVQKGKHLYYRCSNRVHTFPFPPTCKESSVNARIADEAVWSRVKEIMSSPILLCEQVKRWSKNRGNKIPRNVVSTDFLKGEITKLRNQEDRFARAYSEEVITLEKFEEYVKPLREKIRAFESQIHTANTSVISENDFALPNNDEIEAFVQEATKKLEDLNFKTKQAIIRQVINKVVVGGNELQVYGLINLNYHVVFCTEHRNCWFAKCGEIHAF